MASKSSFVYLDTQDQDLVFFSIRHICNYNTMFCICASFGFFFSFLNDDTLQDRPTLQLKPKIRKTLGIWGGTHSFCFFFVLKG